MAKPQPPLQLEDDSKTGWLRILRHMLPYKVRRLLLEHDHFEQMQAQLLLEHDHFEQMQAEVRRLRPTEFTFWETNDEANLRI